MSHHYMSDEDACHGYCTATPNVISQRDLCCKEEEAYLKGSGDIPVCHGLQISRYRHFVTYHKSGTIWMQEMVTLVSSKGNSVRAQTQPNWMRAPWLEQYYCSEVLKVPQEPRLLTTHLPYQLLATALQGTKAKDLRGSLERVSRFLQCPLVEEELTSAERSCSFSSMR
ncbi:hypothetical protein SRHO_G00168870 [Serrasalmus rhombeus]